MKPSVLDNLVFLEERLMHSRYCGYSVLNSWGSWIQDGVEWWLVKKWSIDAENLCSQRSSKLQILGKYLIARTLKHDMSKSVDSLWHQYPGMNACFRVRSKSLGNVNILFLQLTAITMLLRNGNTSCVKSIQDFHTDAYVLRVFGQTMLSRDLLVHCDCPYC